MLVTKKNSEKAAADGKTSVRPKSKKVAGKKDTITSILDGKYELVNKEPIVIQTGFGTFDLGNLSVSQAEKLVSNGYRYIRKANVQ
jgi:hypothetical protein